MVRDLAGPGSAAVAEEGSVRKSGDLADRKRLLGHLVERAIRTVLVVDIIESVRLIELDEEGAIARWLCLVNHVEAELLATAEGRLVKCLGDAMLLEFGNVRGAVSVAFAIQHISKRLNFEVAPDRQMLLRMGSRSEM